MTRWYRVRKVNYQSHHCPGSDPGQGKLLKNYKIMNTATENKTDTATKTGVITQIIGPVVDVHFAEGGVPELLNALTVQNGEETVTLEVALHVGLDRVRAIGMQDTQGLMRGMEVVDTGSAISVPVGEQTLGRLFNVLGKTLDGKDELAGKTKGIHQVAPAFVDQSTKTEVFETGIKSVDLLAPFIKGW